MGRFIPDLTVRHSVNYELNSCFLPNRWSMLTPNQRMDCLQTLENRLAAEQGRPAKYVFKEPMSSGECGYWSKAKDAIFVNSNLVDDMCFVGDGIRSYRPDASILLYDTVAHEGYHAFQDYSLDHPETFEDKERLNEWRINSAEKFDANTGKLLSNYYDPNVPGNENLYRIQPLERDTNDYAYQKTSEAFEELEKVDGPLDEYEEYKNIKEFNSYENALADELQRDPQCLEHMNEEMTQNYRQWSGLEYESDGPSVSDSGQTQDEIADTSLTYCLEDSEMSEYERIKNTPNPYGEDTGYYTHTMERSLSGSNTVYHPSLYEQYSARMGELYSEIEGRELSPKEHDEYLEKVYDLQDELGYYPEFDPRMEAAYVQSMYGVGEAVNSVVAEGDKEQIKSFKESLMEYDAAQRDRLGYYPNRPEEHVQEAYSAAETMNDYTESEDFRLETGETAINAETMKNYTEGEDFSQETGETAVYAETMDGYIESEGYSQGADEQAGYSESGESYSESGESNSMQQG